MKKKTKKVMKKSPKKLAKKTVKKVAAKSPTKKSVKPSKIKTKSKGEITKNWVGQSAPYFSAPDDTGKERSLDEFKGKTIVLYFYPKDDTPGCTVEACDFRDSMSRLQAKGVSILGVSKDSIESHVKFKKKFHLTFPLLSDVKGSICNAYGVWKEKSMYGKSYMGIERTTFVIAVNPDGSGVVKFHYPKVSVPGHVEAIMKDLGF